MSDTRNVRFTVGFDADGNPVQRTLREMRLDEVIAAIQWHHHELVRLSSEADRLFVGMDSGNRTPKAKEIEAFEAAKKAKVAARGTFTRLMALVEAAIPQWQRLADDKPHGRLH